MCGRFALTISPTVLAKLFKLATEPNLKPRYNIAPTQDVAAVRLSPDGSERVLDTLRWGLIPRWAKDPAIGSRMINARCETVAEKPSFKDAFQKRRCLIPADGFYEWRKPADKKPSGKKQPMFIRRPDDSPLLLAGLWELWRGPGADRIESCTILTTAANALVKPIHDRMPVVIDPKHIDLWLGATQDLELLTPLFQPFPPAQLTAYPVSPFVNSPKNDDPRCLEPLPTPSDPDELF
jgi:putative SOS response-associated peptidase YedK